MTCDLIVYTPLPLAALADAWHAHARVLDRAAVLAPDDVAALRTGERIEGFLQVGERAGFELYQRDAEATETADLAAPAAMALMRFAVTFMIPADALRVGHVCAAALAQASGGLILDLYSGDFLTPQAAIAQGARMADAASDEA
jgi:hypothetical protein